MPDLEVTNYFDATEFRKTRDDLVFAVNRACEPKVAIDCGCGAGSDIDYLVRKGFEVHAFDIEEESIARCRARFEGVEDVFLSRCSFSAFEYPSASLVVADASLFFCPASEFAGVWNRIIACLNPNGVFCGSFLGLEDTMAEPGENHSVLWPDVTAFSETQVRGLLRDLEVLRFNVHKSTGINSQGAVHRWHIFQVVARKPPNAGQRDALKRGSC